MFTHQITKLASALVLATAVSGCAGTVAKTTSEKNRVTSGAYDGVWQVDVLKSAGIQNINQWQLSCGDMRTTFTIDVVDGAVVVGNKAKPKKAYVSNKGRFKMYYPIAHKATASGNSSGTMNNGNMQIILRGKLDKEDSAGYITYGIAELGYGGCTAKTRFKYLGLPEKDVAI